MFINDPLYAMNPRSISTQPVFVATVPEFIELPVITNSARARATGP